MSQAHGLKVVGIAPTLQALAELDDVGLQQRDSLARTALGDGEFSIVMRRMDHRTVVLVDEAGMAQTKQIAPLLARAAERGAKVVARAVAGSRRGQSGGSPAPSSSPVPTAAPWNTPTPARCTRRRV